MAYYRKGEWTLWLDGQCLEQNHKTGKYSLASATNMAKTFSSRKAATDFLYEKLNNASLTKWEIRSPGGVRYGVKKPVRKNGVFSNMDAAKQEGLRLASTKERKAYLQKNLPRIQASVYLRAMVKALGLHPWLNTVGEWQRYYEAKYILKLRAKR